MLMFMVKVTVMVKVMVKVMEIIENKYTRNSSFKSFVQRSNFIFKFNLLYFILFIYLTDTICFFKIIF